MNKGHSQFESGHHNSSKQNIEMKLLNFVLYTLCFLFFNLYLLKYSLSSSEAVSKSVSFDKNLNQRINSSYSVEEHFKFPLRNLIEKGENVSGKRPFFVVVNIRDRQRCGGSIITAYWVITAAHCVFPFKR